MVHVGTLIFIRRLRTCFIKSKEECKDQESIHSSTTPDPRHFIGNAGLECVPEILFFLFLDQSIFCGYSKEPSR